MVQVNINKLNSQINLLSVCLGLIISIIVLFVGAIAYSGFSPSGITNISIYIGAVLLLMTFLGSIVTGFLGDKNFSEGSINGAFLSLIILILTSLILVILLFVSILLITSLASALGPFASTASPTTTTTTGNDYTLFNTIEFIIFIILFFVTGMLGGAFGVFLKQGIKQITGRNNKINE